MLGGSLFTFNDGSWTLEDPDDRDIAVAVPPEEIVEVHEAIDQWIAVDPKAAELVKLRYFVGLTNAGIGGPPQLRLMVGNVVEQVPSTKAGYST
jgi:hypothetical protein